MLMFQIFKNISKFQHSSDIGLISHIFCWNINRHYSPFYDKFYLVWYNMSHKVDKWFRE